MEKRESGAEFILHLKKCTLKKLRPSSSEQNLFLQSLHITRQQLFQILHRCNSKTEIKKKKQAIVS